MAFGFAAAVFVGRSTAVAGGPSMVWPAAGASVIWYYPHAQQRWRGAWRALLLLNAITVALNLATGAPPLAVAVYCLANSVMAVVGADVLGRGRNRDWAQRLDSPGRLYQLFLASLAGGVVSGAVGSLLLFATGGPWISPVDWAMRNTAGALIVGLLWYRIARHGVRVLDKPKAYVRLLLALGTMVSYVLVILLADGALLFLVVPVSMAVALWADVRTTVWHTVTVSSVVVLVTVLGRGPLMGHSPNARALIVQTFVVVLAMVAMTIVLDREDRRRLERHLEAHRLATEQHAALLDRIVGSLSEGVALVDAMGHVVLGNAELRRILRLSGPASALVLPTGIFDIEGTSAAPVNEVLRTGELIRSDVVLAEGDAPPGSSPSPRVRCSPPRGRRSSPSCGTSPTSGVASRNSPTSPASSRTTCATR